MKCETLQHFFDQIILERDDLHHKIESLKNENNRKLKSLKDEIEIIEDEENLDHEIE